MYSFLHNLLKDHSDGTLFTCFSVWHFLYIILAVALVTVFIILCKDKEQSVKERVLRVFSGIAFGLYMADFFLMPFAFGEIHVEKLPFHGCTAMCVMCFASNHSRVLRKYRRHFALLGLICNLMYLVYPAGVMWYEITPYSYRAIQTLLFHTSMVTYGVLALTFDEEGMSIRHSYRDLAILGGMTVWSLIGNTLYTGSAGEYSENFNWFFIKEDPFGILSAEIGQYVLPFVNIAVFFAVEMIIYLIFMGIRKAKRVKAAA